MEFDTLAKLEFATANIHKDFNNFEKQGEVNIETKKSKGTALRSRIKWQQVGDK